MDTPKLLPSSILGMSSWTHILTCKREESSLNERKRYKLQKPEQATLFTGGSELQLTVLHFSISVLISGLTFSIRSTRFALLFIIPPGMTKTLVPPTDNRFRMVKVRKLQERFIATFITYYECTYPCPPHLHLPAFSSWHSATKQSKIAHLVYTTAQMS